jgi:multidrug efflux pump subunit AcrA (membrane-fusion protein)
MSVTSATPHVHPTAGPAAPHTHAPAGRSDVTGLDAQLVHETQQEIRALVHEIAQLAQSQIEPAEFYRGFLTRVTSAMAAVGGAVWNVAADAALAPAYQINLAAAGLDASADARRRHEGLLQSVVTSNQPLLVPPHSGAGAEAGNPSEFLLVLAPLRLEQKVVGIIEVVQRPGGGPATQRGYARFLSQMAELAGDYLKNQLLRELADERELSRQLEGFVEHIHRSLSLTDVSYALVNEGRRLVGCDRLSLAIYRGGSCRVTTVNGLDAIDRRAAEVRRLGQLAQAVLKTGEPLWHAGEGHDLAPQIESHLQPYVDQSHARLVAVLPLAPTGADDLEGSTSRRRPVGALIVEQLGDNRAGTALRKRANLVARHGALALAHAIEHESIFLMPLWKLLGQAGWFLRGRPLVWSLVVSALAAAALVALAKVPADFEVAARGKLQPVERRDIFAAIDGDVVDVRVRHGDFVQPGDLLVQLASADLDEELQRLVGRQKTNQEQIASANKRLLDSARGSGSRLTPADESRLAGELLQLKQEAENIRREMALFYEKQKRLKIVAQEPGQVVTWQVEQQLLRRPVARGQVLMTIANPAGPWELELYMPERRLKHLMDAQKNWAQAGAKPRSAGGVDGSGRPPLDVVFTLASHPGAEFRGQVVEIEQTAEVRGEEGNTVLVRVAIDAQKLPPLHDQTSVTARLYCGRRSLGYVWFCDLIETVQGKVLFWF